MKQKFHGGSTNLGFPDLALAVVTGGGTLIAESAVRLEALLLGSDLAGCFVNVRIEDGDAGAGGLSREVIALCRWMRFQVSAKKLT